jgi:hypothetical protein
MQSGANTTTVKSLILVYGACIRSVISSMGLPLPPPMKTDFHDITEILLKVALSTVNLNLNHRRLCRVKNMLAMYLKYHKAGLTPTTPVTSIAISSVKMSIGCKSLTNLHSEMIFLQGKPVFYIFLPSTPPY